MVGWVVIEIGQIYCDMDQVLVNFLGGARQVFGTEFNDSCLGSEQDKFTILGQIPLFWLNLDWMPNAQILWNRIKDKDTYILTACPPANLNPTCPSEKKQWGRQELKISKKRILTVERKNKKKFAVTNGQANLLIDDHGTNVFDWIAAGGVAIHHYTVPETLIQLQQFL